MSKDNSMLVDIQYVRPRKGTSTTEKTPDFLYIISKNLDTMEKKLDIIESPKVDIYFEKDEYRNHDFNLIYQHIEKLERHTCLFRNISSEIVKDMGEPGYNFIQNVRDTGNYKELRKLNLYPYVFGHDYDVRALYRYMWSRDMFNNRPKVLTKGFLDIEADSINVKGFADAKSCPIDLVTVIDGYEKKSYTFALISQEYNMPNFDNFFGRDSDKEKLMKKCEEKKKLYENRHKAEQEILNDLDGLKKELHDMFDETYGNIDYNFYFYTDEKKMLIHIFQLINKLKLDFMFIWNISFDIPYIIERLQVLGLDPAEVMCHPDFPVKECYFKKDKKNFDIKNKSDAFHLSSYTNFYDQMILYAAIRKGQQELRSNKLTAIAKKVIGDEKLNYDEEGEFKTFPYKNYRKYFIYNIKDVLLQYGIENFTHDAETLYVKATENITPYENVFKQTVVLRNVQYKEFMKNDMVPGGNINIFSYDKAKEDDDEVGFEGALVGNPKLINKFGKKMFNRKTNYIFDYSIDMDMAAFYPSSIRVMNIDASTLIFKVILNADNFDVRGGKIPFKGITDVQLVNENDDTFVDDVAKEIFDNFQTGNYLTLGHKVMNLPSISELNDMVKAII